MRPGQQEEMAPMALRVATAAILMRTTVPSQWTAQLPLLAMVPDSVIVRQRRAVPKALCSDSGGNVFDCASHSDVDYSPESVDSPTTTSFMHA